MQLIVKCRTKCIGKTPPRNTQNWNLALGQLALISTVAFNGRCQRIKFPTPAALADRFWLLPKIAENALCFLARSIFLCRISKIVKCYCFYCNSLDFNVFWTRAWPDCTDGASRGRFRKQTDLQIVRAQQGHWTTSLSFRINLISVFYCCQILGRLQGICYCTRSPFGQRRLSVGRWKNLQTPAWIRCHCCNNVLYEHLKSFGDVGCGSTGQESSRERA